MATWNDGAPPSLSGDEGMVPPAVRAARAALRQKYRHLKHALMEDDMQFTHDNYDVKPMSGEVRKCKSHCVTKHYF